MKIIATTKQQPLSRQYIDTGVGEYGGCILATSDDGNILITFDLPNYIIWKKEDGICYPVKMIEYTFELGETIIDEFESKIDEYVQIELSEDYKDKWKHEHTDPKYFIAKIWLAR